MDHMLLPHAVVSCQCGTSTIGPVQHHATRKMQLAHNKTRQGQPARHNYTQRYNSKAKIFFLLVNKLIITLWAANDSLVL